MRNIVVRQTEASSFVRSVAPLPRFVIGAVVAAFVAYHLPMILVALSGRWINNLTMWLQTAIIMTALIVVNILGNKLRLIWPLGIAVGIVWTLYEISWVMRAQQLEDWPLWWMVVAVPLPICL